MSSSTAKFYSELVFGKPRLVMSILLVFVAFFAWHAQNFRLDASADSLLLEDDPDLEFSREISSRYGAGDSLIIAYTPKDNLFHRTTLQKLSQLRDELMTVQGIQSVDSILNVPIFGDTPLTGISENYLTILDEEQDLDLAREEIVQSPIFQNALLSADGETAGLLVGFEIDEISRELLFQRAELQKLQRSGEISAEQIFDLGEIEAEYAEYSVIAADRQHEIISSVRSILDGYRDGAVIYLGGAPMIADDLVTFVRADLQNFSIA